MGIPISITAYIHDYLNTEWIELVDNHLLYESWGVQIHGATKQFVDYSTLLPEMKFLGIGIKLF